MLNVTSSAFDYIIVLKRVAKDFANNEILTFYYASGKSLRVESAARMAVMTGVSQVTAQINESNAKELDTEYFEVTCHGGARPSHQELQGKVYSIEGGDEKYPNLKKVTGYQSNPKGLFGYNCRHNLTPFDLETMKNHFEKFDD